MGADFVVGIDLSGGQRLEPPKGIIDVILNSMEIAVRHQARLHTDEADVVIRMDVRQYGKPGGANVQRLYERGYEVTKAEIPRIKAGLKEKQPSTVDMLAHKIKSWRSGD